MKSGLGDIRILLDMIEGWAKDALQEIKKPPTPLIVEKLGALHDTAKRTLYVAESLAYSRSVTNVLAKDIRRAIMLADSINLLYEQVKAISAERDKLIAVLQEKKQ